ncbi:MAG: glycerate kinase [Aphanothece sp. CMT-3BRIN-NPC111]|jgi:D-glycerate 3-kinase|nr:glycerate kinase [Aphanothece sp. CMT-3BRIN-NPC111]
MSQPNVSLSQILEGWTAGQTPTAQELQQLAKLALADQPRSLAFGITQGNVDEVVRERSHLFCSIYPTLVSSSILHGSSFTLETLWNLWLPLAMQLAQYRQQLGHPFIQGILGVQGTGKSTLAAILRLILKHLGYHALCLSLDDLYKTYAERLSLIKEDPRLIWRGPPGTHDIQLGLTVLDRLRQPNQIAAIEVPRFDKSAWGGAGDRTQPEVVEGVDIVLFEGWFIGVRPIDPVALDTAPAPILTAADRLFARDMNIRLQDYLPLWEKLDRLIVLYPVDYHLSLQWRLQAEHQMIAAGKSGMTDSEIEEFVNYFWKALHPELFIKPLTGNSNWVDMVIEINAGHSVSGVYRPS